VARFYTSPARSQRSVAIQQAAESWRKTLQLQSAHVGEEVAVGAQICFIEITTLATSKKHLATDNKRRI
jgi:hypothetical protein